MATTDEKKLKKLLDILKMVDEGITKEEFVEAFQKVIEYVKNIDKRNEEDFTFLRNTITALKKKVEDDSAESSKELVKQLDFISKEVKAVRAEKDRKAGEISFEVLNQVRDRMPKIEELKNDLPKLGAPIRDSLELLQGDDRLDKSAIKGLEEDLKKISEAKGSGNAGGGAVARTRVHYYDLTSQCNGVLKTFAVPLNFGIIGVFSTQFPVNYRPLVDWTEGNRTLTLTSEVSAPETGQTLWIAYLK